MQRIPSRPQALLRLFVSVALSGIVAAQDLSNEPVMMDTEIQRILAERIEQKQQGVGIVVGVIEDRGERIVAHGALNQGDPRPLSGATVFEIGGLSGVFTALLLADMARKGEVNLIDPVSRYLPPAVKLPVEGARPITLADLATHTAGLPLLPPNFKAKNPANPYVDLGENDLYESLANYKLNGRLGSDYRYSNVGMSLLALALSRRAGQSYDVLLKTRIFDPLGMKNTAFVPTREMTAQLATGHNGYLQPVANWDSSVMAGAVGIKSTAQDLLTFIEAAIGYKQSPLSPSFRNMLSLRKSTRYPGLETALGWHILSTSSNQIVWCNGGTGGFRSFMGYSLRSKVGIVVLSNTNGGNAIEDIGLRLFSPIPQDVLAERQHTEIMVDPRILGHYAGVYQLSDGMQLTVSVQGDHLTAALGQQTFQLAAESTKDFFVKNVEGQITFVTDRSGNAYMLVLHQAGTDMSAKKIQ